MKEEIFKIIEEGLDSKNLKARQTAKKFAEGIKRTAAIVKEEKKFHIKEHGSDYLRQLVLMTHFILNNKKIPIEKRLKRIAEKLEELEWHQTHQLVALRKARLQAIERKTGKKKTGKKKAGKKEKNKAREKKEEKKGKNKTKQKIKKQKIKKQEKLKEGKGKKENEKKESARK